MYGFLTVISVWWLYRKKRTDIKNAAESLMSGPAAASPLPLISPRCFPLPSARVQLQPVGFKDADCYLLQVREKIYEGRRRKMQIVLAV